MFVSPLAVTGLVPEELLPLLLKEAAVENAEEGQEREMNVRATGHGDVFLRFRNIALCRRTMRPRRCVHSNAR